MDKKTFLDTITQLGTITDDVERRTILTNLSDEVSKVYDEKDSLNTTITSLNEKLTKTSEDLTKAQKANMDLFLRVGTQKSGAEINSSSTGVKDEPEKDKRKFEDLFKEEGGDK